MELVILRKSEISAFKGEMQEAFQKGFEDKFGKANGVILPEEDINLSLSKPATIAYEAIENGERLGGAIISLSDNGARGELDFLYTKVGCQNRGVAGFVWKSIEQKHPDIKIWETCTPYFDVRNIHFYVNRCGFHIVEYFNDHHPDPHDFAERDPDPMGGEGMFRFEKSFGR